MSDKSDGKTNERESIFLNEIFMTLVFVIVALTSIVSLIFCIREGDSFAIFQVTTKLVVATAMILAFRYYKWEVVKGLMCGLLFSLMYQEAYLVFVELWGEQNFDTYLVAGVQGSIHLAAAGMTFLMTVIILKSNKKHHYIKTPMACFLEKQGITPFFCLT